MISRAMLSRLNAIKGVFIPKKEVSSEKLYAIDPLTMEDKLVFDSIDDALIAGYLKPNLNKAINTKTKYKGCLWCYK